MKKLKMALIVAFALSCSLFLFACGGSTRTLKSIAISGYTTEYYDVNADASSPTAVSLGDLAIEATYTTDDGTETEAVSLDDENVTLDYEDLAAAYESGTIGSYTVKVAYKVVDSDGNSTQRSQSYTATISHNFETQSDGSQVCKNCGAIKETIAISDHMEFPDWGSTDATVYTSDDGVYGELVNERWVKYGTIDRGQSYTLTGTIWPTNSEGWDTPMFAIQANGTGLAIRTDNWIIHSGNAIGGYDPLYTTNITDAAATTGATADADSEDWVVYLAGSSGVSDSHFGSASYSSTYGEGGNGGFTYSVTYDEDGIITIVYAADDGTSASYSMKVPDNVYDVLFFGEECCVDVTEVAITKNFEMTNLTITSAVEKTVYAENTYFDRTGMVVMGSYSKGSDVEITAYAVYGETDDGTATLLNNGGTDVAVITADMTKFYLTYGDFSCDLSLTVIESPVTGASENYYFLYNGVEFYAGDASYTYDVNSSSALTIFASGYASILTAEQIDALGSDYAAYSYYISFHIFSTADVEAITSAIDGAVVCETANGGVNVILPVSSSTLTTKSIEFTVSGVSYTVYLDLSKLDIPSVGSYVVSNEAYFDVGGDIVVAYEGITSSTISNYTFYVNASAQAYTTTLNKIGSTGVAFEFAASGNAYGVPVGTLLVTYTFSALEISASSSLTKLVGVYLTGGSMSNPDASETLTYNLSASSSSTTYFLLGSTGTTETYLYASGTTLRIVVVETSPYLNGDISALYLNVGSSTGAPYDLAFSATDSGIAFNASNVLTNNATAFVLVNGTIDNNTDRDVAAVYVMNINVSNALGYSQSDGYYVEYCEDDYYNNNTSKSEFVFYNIASSISAITVSKDSYTATTVAGSCVDNEYSYYSYNSSFGFGYVLLVSATGQHAFGAYTDGQAVCSVCGTVSTLTTVGDSVYAVTIGTTVTELVNNDTSGDWWDGLTNTIPNLSGNFALYLTYENTRDTDYYQDVVIEFYDGNYLYFDINFMCGGGWGDLLTACTSHTTTWTLNGTALDAAPTQGSGSYAFGGTYEITLFRVGDILVIIQTLTNTDGDVYEAIDVFEGFTTEQVTFEITGNPYWVDTITYSSGNAYDYVSTVGADLYLGSASVLTNNDTSGDWWDGATNYISVSGDFAAAFTYENTRDTDWYQDVVIEMYDASYLYFDMNVLCGGGWGDLLTACTSHTTTWTLNGTALDAAPTQGSGSYAFDGTYTIYVYRVGSTLTIVQTIANTAGDVYQAVDVCEGFTTANVMLGFTGNPYWVDEISYQTGYAVANS